MLPIASNAVDLILVDPSAAEPPSGCAVADAASIGIYVVRSYGFQALGATPQQASSSSCQACATHHKRLPGTRTCGSTFTLGSSPQSRMRHVC